MVRYVHDILCASTITYYIVIIVILCDVKEKMAKKKKKKSSMSQKIKQRSINFTLLLYSYY